MKTGDSNHTFTIPSKNSCNNISGYWPVAVPSELAHKIEKMPKVEIHVHVEGATSPEVYWELARKNNIQLPAKSLEEFKSFFVFRDFNHFIEVFVASIAALQTPEDYYYIVERFMAYQSEQNIVWTQAFLSLSVLPQMDRRLFFEALKSAVADGEKRYGVYLSLIGDIGRHLPETQNTVTELVIDGFKQGVFKGLGLGGIELNYPPGLFLESYQKAFQNGVELFAHAGETTGPQTIQESVDLLKVKSIGHGISVLENPELIKRLAKEGTVFEVCPQSNYATGLVPFGHPHPIRKMVDAGLVCTINSDDPAMFSSSLTHEYKLLAAQGFSFEELWKLNLNAFNAASIPQETRAKVANQFPSKFC